MKQALLSAIISILFMQLAYAQASSSALTTTIKGMVTDSVKNVPLPYVTVALVDPHTNAPVKSTFTKDDGSFVLSGLPVKAYKLMLVYVGYGGKAIAINPARELVNLGKIQLSPASSQLAEVNVTAVKPLMKREVDRISYDVQADPENKVLTVLDMLRKTPLLSVDAADNIKLQGNTNFKILINNRPSALVAKNPSDIFKAMPASNILKIEVITTPPAKYDAEGLAGIINIITKKDVDQGYNGSVSVRYSNLYGPGSNVNFTLKKGKFGFGGYAGYNKQNNQTNNMFNLNDVFGVSTLTQQGSRTNGGNNTYGNAELSYETDSLNLFTGSFEYYKGNWNTADQQLSNLLLADNTLSRAYQSQNKSNIGYQGLAAGLNYQLGFKRNKEQLLTASYKYNSSTNNQFNSVLFFERVNYPTGTYPNYQQFNNSGTREHTLQLDYVQPFKKLTLETGAKAIFRNNYSDLRNDLFDTPSDQYVTDPAQTYNFDYQQNVYSLYNSYQYKLSKWVAKGGLRLEYTTVNANALASNQHYNNLIPSLSVQRELSATSNINLGYTDRIQRPGIWQLNPFINSSNPNFINIGNPDLRPVVSHGIELNYSNFKKGSFNVGLNYKFASNTIEGVTSNTGGANAISVTTFQNIGKNKRLGIDMNTNYPLTEKLNVNLNTELVHVWLRGVYNGQFYNNRGFQGHVFGSSSYKFTNGYRIGINIDYDSRYVLLQGRDNFWFGYAASASKEFLNKKATISLFVGNPFNKIRVIDNYNRTPDFYQFSSFEMYSRRINVSFNYKFGKLSGNIKKNQRGISNDDVSGGRRN